VFFRKSSHICLIAILAISVGSSASAQQSHNGVRGEQVARARWQPVRPTQNTEELPAPVPSQRAARPPQAIDPYGESIMQPVPMGRGNVYHEPLDGQIIHDSGDYIGGFGAYGGSGCDAMGCSCGMGCDGGCDSMYGSCGPGGCDPCVGGAWRPCVTLCFPQNGWVSLEYLGWAQRGMRLPPLITTNVGAIPAQGQAGVLGGPTRVLFGGEEVLDDGFSGGRLQFGLWLDRCHTWAVAAEYFELGSRTQSFSGNSNAYPVLARPFFNTLTGQQDSQLVSYPNFATGNLNAQATSSLVGGSFHLRHQTGCGSGCGRGLLCDGCSMFHSRTDTLFGYRYLQLDESVSIAENLVGTGPGQSFRINDRFRTFNQFNGFDMGMAYNRQRGCWSADLLVRLAIGNTRQRVDINGNTSINGAAAQQGGLLAQTTNIGSYSRDQFTVLPEFGAGVGYQLTHNLRLKAGYTLIFWSNVVRPGDQIDMDVNPNLFPPAVSGGTSRPQFQFVDSDYWVQGVNLGAEYTW
jgi:hypothetical protein